MSEPSQVNDHLVLIVGKSSSGKSASLRDLKDPEGVLYLNCEAGKKLPFRNNFITKIITKPEQIAKAFAAAEKSDKVHTIVIDTLTYLMDMCEKQLVLDSSNTMQGWQEFAQYFKQLMQQHVANSSKNVIMLAHTLDILNEKEGVMETYVPIKGSIKNNGVESYFSTVISTKKMTVNNLEKYVEDNDLLEITPQEQALGFKHVFQTQLTQSTVNERIRGPMGMWEQPETYIDNNAQRVLDRLHEYYS